MMCKPQMDDKLNKIAEGLSDDEKFVLFYEFARYFVDSKKNEKVDNNTKILLENISKVVDNIENFEENSKKNEWRVVIVEKNGANEKFHKFVLTTTEKMDKSSLCMIIQRAILVIAHRDNFYFPLEDERKVLEHKDFYVDCDCSKTLQSYLKIRYGYSFKDGGFSRENDFYDFLQYMHV